MERIDKVKLWRLCLQSIGGYVTWLEGDPVWIQSFNVCMFLFEIQMK